MDNPNYPDLLCHLDKLTILITSIDILSIWFELSLAQLSPSLYFYFCARLVSAYQDKYVDRNNHYKKKLLKQYKQISFPNFIDFLIQGFKKSCK